ncbi:tachylectin-related carbohydrate-binding protein [Saccharothrix texasensis]|uniref:Tachylectin 2 domain-containing protein n=1 Tax=Saccharothrix texasensis TaxID=103734 RepID=A0A3N1H0I9_9PSEU|nr:tachylectin-related carbohydrate-binding protein [Saccharothrix texasensis]ROP35994.1 hypothetical protein EDD40_1253 [Saccharothrix texasensis]
MPGTTIKAMTAVFVAAVTAVTAATATATAAPAEAVTTARTVEVTATSTIGGQITRSEVLARAADWYDRRHDADLTYDQGAKAWDVGRTRQYRRDCSGYVGMAWHLGYDPNTDGLDESTLTVPISRAELRPGDLLNDRVNDDGGRYPYHAILFGGWENAAKTTFWYYSFGSTPVAKVTGASFGQSSLSGHPTSHYRALRYRKIVDDGVSGTASVYGVLADGRLTYTAVDAADGTRTHGAVTSGASLGFVPKAMATVNFNTILVTSPAGQLYRVDVITNDTSLTFAAPVPLGGGWTHDLLAYDGRGSLYGIAAGALRRYTVAATKPGAGDITSDGLIDTGFTLKTLTATGQDWLLGTTSGGELLSYRIRGAGDWTRYELKSSTWQVFTDLVSPGGGVYFGHNADGGLYHYLDADPYDGSGADLRGLDAVDAQGWSQVLLSAQPATVA